MSFDPLSAIFELGKSAVERIWPDPIRRAEELRKLEELRLRGDAAELDAHVKLIMGQLQVNAAEASHKSIFVAGWRPFIGWVGGAAMAYQFVVYPIMIWIWAILQVKEIVPKELDPPPVLETGALFSIVTGMLGLGAMRSIDKSKGTDTKKVG
ncbi:MAG: holin family protein [Colwellia sp.]|nr:holin family protein [Colwellia sp.]